VRTARRGAKPVAGDPRRALAQGQARCRAPLVTRLACLLFLLLTVTSPREAFPQEQGHALCRRDDKECAAAALKGHIVTKLAYWKRSFDRPVGERVGAAPRELVEYLALDNIKSGFPNAPRSEPLPEDFLRDVRAAISEMPRQVRHVLSGKLAGIYFVEDLGGTGYTDMIFDAASSAVAGFVVLDPGVLDRAANAWATWKENTPFRAAPGFRLSAVIEAERDDNRKNAIQYILLHEFGHVLAIGEKFHPPWNIEPNDVPDTADFPFFRLSWTVSRPANRYASIYDAFFTQRKDVVYYLGAKLSADQTVATYRNLERTNFATLYASTHPADDFAEAFASYVHTALMRKPFEIRIYEDGRIARTYKSCWTEQRCAEKKRILENFLGSAER